MHLQLQLAAQECALTPTPFHTGSRATWRCRMQLPKPQTICDGLEARLGSLTWPLVRDLVDDVITVSEAEVVAAMRLVMERMKVRAAWRARAPAGAAGCWCAGALACASGGGQANDGGQPTVSAHAFVERSVSKPCVCRVHSAYSHPKHMWCRAVLCCAVPCSCR